MYFFHCCFLSLLNFSFFSSIVSDFVLLSVFSCSTMVFLKMVIMNYLSGSIHDNFPTLDICPYHISMNSETYKTIFKSCIPVIY